jgi:hypothetical protein
MGNGDVVKGFHHGSSGQGGLVTPPNPCSLRADSNRPKQGRKRMSSSWVRVRSTSRGGEEVEPIDHGAESEGSISSTRPSRPYTLSLPDGSSDAGADLNPLQKDSGDSGTSLVSLKDGEGVVAVVAQLETPESSCTPGADALGE